jgi:hypothetical protein
MSEEHNNFQKLGSSWNDNYFQNKFLSAIFIINTCFYKNNNAKFKMEL